MEVGISPLPAPPFRRRAGLVIADVVRADLERRRRRGCWRPQFVMPALKDDAESADRAETVAMAASRRPVLAPVRVTELGGCRHCR